MNNKSNDTNSGVQFAAFIFLPLSISLNLLMFPAVFHAGQWSVFKSDYSGTVATFFAALVGVVGLVTTTAWGFRENRKQRAERLSQEDRQRELDRALEGYQATATLSSWLLRLKRAEETIQRSARPLLPKSPEDKDQIRTYALNLTILFESFLPKDTEWHAHAGLWQHMPADIQTRMNMAMHQFEAARTQVSIVGPHFKDLALPKSELEQVLHTLAEGRKFLDESYEDIRNLAHHNARILGRENVETIYVEHDLWVLTTEPLSDERADQYCWSKA